MAWGLKLFRSFLDLDLALRYHLPCSSRENSLGLFLGPSSDTAWYRGPGWQEAWPQWCTGPYVLPSIAPYRRMPNSWHTGRWCKQSGCSRQCNCSTFWGSGDPCQVFTVLGGKGGVVPSSQLSKCVWTMIVRWWCGHQGPWNSRPVRQSFSYSPWSAPLSCSH